MPRNRKKKRQPYVSQKRDEPRPLLRRRSLDDNENIEPQIIASEVDPREGWLTYRPSGPGFWRTINQGKMQNRYLIKRHFSKECEYIPECIELLYGVPSRIIWIPETDPYVIPNASWQVVEGTFTGALTLLATSFELTLDGLYTHARPLLRQLFEGLMIAKLCSLDHSTEVYDKWLDGAHTNFTNDIINRITHPGREQFVDLWKSLSGDTQASYFSGQPDVNNGPALRMAQWNFAFLHMLLHATYHLLRTHLTTPSIRYRQREWFPDKELGSLRLKLTEHLSFSKAKILGSDAKQFMKDFSSNWTLS